jgi:hypothetical protein
MMVMSGFFPFWNFVKRCLLPENKCAVHFRTGLFITFTIWIGFAQGTTFLIIFSLASSDKLLAGWVKHELVMSYFACKFVFGRPQRCDEYVCSALVCRCDA